MKRKKKKGRKKEGEIREVDAFLQRTREQYQNLRMVMTVGCARTCVQNSGNGIIHGFVPGAFRTG